MAEIEARVVAAAHDWSDDLSQALAVVHGDARGQTHFHNYNLAFPAGYREQFEAEAAVEDIAKIESALTTGQPHLNLYRTGGMGPESLRLKIYAKTGPIPLSDVLPMLENMGLKVIDEVPHVIVPRHAEGEFWIHDFGLVSRSGATADIAAVKDKFEDAFARVWAGEVERRRLQPPRSRRRACLASDCRCCAPIRATCARPASRSRRLHGRHARRQPGDRGVVGRAVRDAVRSRRAARRRGSREEDTRRRSWACSKRWRIRTRTASCADS